MLESLQAKTVKQVAACGFHTAALTDSGEIFTWGEGESERGFACFYRLLFCLHIYVLYIYILCSYISSCTGIVSLGVSFGATTQGEGVGICYVPVFLCIAVFFAFSFSFAYIFSTSKAYSETFGAAHLHLLDNISSASLSRWMCEAAAEIFAPCLSLCVVHAIFRSCCLFFLPPNLFELPIFQSSHFFICPAPWPNRELKSCFLRELGRNLS